MARSLVVNADDFGFTCDVNRGIVDAHRHGILTATTLMANGAAFDNAVRLAQETPTLDVGVHCVLVSGRSLLDPQRPLPATVKDLLVAILMRKLHPYAELRAQVEKILAAGIRPTHLDTHKHTHLLPPVLDAVARLGGEFGIPWIRRPLDFPAMGLLRRRFHRVLSAHGCRTTDHFTGYQVTGRFHTAELVALLDRLPEGLTEFMTHPGYCTEELSQAKTRLKQSRQIELEALTAPETRAALTRGAIRLVGFRTAPSGHGSVSEYR